MAVGDDAAAAGLAVYPATADVRQGYVALNERGDELARHMTDGTHPFTRITGQLANAQLANGAVTEPKISSGAVTNLKIASDAVSNSKIANGAVNGPKIADRTIERDKLAKRYVAGTAVLSGGQAGTTIETGLLGTVVMVVTARDFALGTTYAAVPANGTGRFTVKYWSTEGNAGAFVNWIAMEV